MCRRGREQRDKSTVNWRFVQPRTREARKDQYSQDIGRVGRCLAIGTTIEMVLPAERDTYNGEGLDRSSFGKESIAGYRCDSYRAVRLDDPTIHH